MLRGAPRASRAVAREMRASLMAKARARDKAKVTVRARDKARVTTRATRDRPAAREARTRTEAGKELRARTEVAKAREEPARVMARAAVQAVEVPEIHLPMGMEATPVMNQEEEAEIPVISR